MCLANGSDYTTASLILVLLILNGELQTLHRDVELKCEHPGDS